MSRRWVIALCYDIKTLSIQDNLYLSVVVVISRVELLNVTGQFIHVQFGVVAALCLAPKTIHRSVETVGIVVRCAV